MFLQIKVFKFQVIWLFLAEARRPKQQNTSDIYYIEMKMMNSAVREKAKQKVLQQGLQIHLKVDSTFQIVGGNSALRLCWKNVKQLSLPKVLSSFLEILQNYYI